MCSGVLWGGCLIVCWNCSMRLCLDSLLVCLLYGLRLVGIRVSGLFRCGVVCVRCFSVVVVVFGVLCVGLGSRYLKKWCIGWVFVVLVILLVVCGRCGLRLKFCDEVC